MLRKQAIGGMVAAAMITSVLGAAASGGAASANAAGPAGAAATVAVPSANQSAATQVSPGRKRHAIVRSQCPHRFGTVRYSKWYARKYMAMRYGWGSAQYQALERLWYHESNWLHRAGSVSGAYGIPQALPGAKMRSAGADWRTNPETQIRWGLRYIKSVYGSPTRAYGHWRSRNWY